jgi:hypothetical protein
MRYQSQHLLSNGKMMVASTYEAIGGAAVATSNLVSATRMPAAGALSMYAATYVFGETLEDIAETLVSNSHSTHDQEMLQVEDEEEDWIGQRSRIKEELCHWYHNFLLPRGCPIINLLFELIVHVSCNFMKEDCYPISTMLHAKGVEDLMAHFYHNCEWWKMHMDPSKASYHATKIHVIQVYIATGPVIQYHYLDEMAEHFTKFVNACTRGYFESLLDVSTYLEDGIDTNGLTIRLHLKGSVQAETIHASMAHYLGPYGVGKETANHLLVNLLYHYNVNAKIHRRGAQNHGHP